MQRRFTIALALTALVSILLVGFGVLAIAQLGARGKAEDQVTRGLNVVSDFLETSGQTRFQLEALLFGARGNLGLDYTEPVLVSQDGVLLPVADRQRRRGFQAAELPGLVLDEQQVSDLIDGETVLISTEGQVFGIRSLATAELATGGDAQLAILAGQRVSAVSRDAVVWFIASSIVVLGGALLAGSWLARRMTGPIKDIEDTTSAIAAGNLAARVETSTQSGARGRDEVTDLANAVNKMAEDLERSKALDRQFLMSVSHDLRTPLTAISGYAEGLQDGAVTDPQAAGEVIGNHAQRLDHLVGDLLDLARLDANRFKLNQRDFDLPVVAGRTMAGVANRADQHGIAMTRTGFDSLQVHADSDRVAQAIANLIDNAVKFAQSTIEVNVERLQVSDGQHFGVVSVSDDGPGIAEADLEHIFDRLYTGKAQPKRAENPTGLGLAIVRELASAMGGFVTAANNRDQGARISLALPLAQSPTVHGDLATGNLEPGQPVQSPQAAVSYPESGAQRPVPSPSDRQATQPPAMPAPRPPV